MVVCVKCVSCAGEPLRRQAHAVINRVSGKEQWGGASVLSAGHSSKQSSENVTQRSLRWRASTVTRRASAAAAALPQRNN